MGTGLYYIGGKIRFCGVLASALGVISLVTFCAVTSVRNFDVKPVKSSAGKTKEYQRTLAEGVSVSQHGLYGVDILQCGSCRIEKMRMGPFTFGGLNVLVVDNLNVVIPPKEESRTSAAQDGDRDRSSARDIARRLGVSDGLLQSRGLPLKFSGLRITKLAVDALLADRKSVEKIFNADSAEAVGCGLALSGCTVFYAGRGEEFIGKAMLSKSGDGLCLSWNGGQLNF